MRFDPPKLGAGFGLRAGVYDDAEVEDGCLPPDPGDSLAGRLSKGTRQPSANVLDYDGCCLFSFVFVGYVSSFRCDPSLQIS